MEVNDVLQISSISKQHSLHACSDALLGIYTSCQLTTFIFLPLEELEEHIFYLKMSFKKKIVWVMQTLSASAKTLTLCLNEASWFNPNTGVI